jgi:hypothetical protein
VVAAEARAQKRTMRNASSRGPLLPAIAQTRSIYFASRLKLSGI